MINLDSIELKNIILYNGLYTTSKVLLKNLKREFITDKEYIEAVKKMFDLYEQLKEQK